MTERARALVLLSCAFAGGCGTKIVQTASEPGAAVERDAGGVQTSDAARAAPRCGPRLVDRLTVTDIGVDTDIRYKRRGYDLVPEDERIAFSVAPSGEARIAWLEDSLKRVHVTPLTAALTRDVVDTVVEGIDLGGVVAREDGFALLTRRVDPGEPLRDPAAGGAIATAAFLVRVRSGSESFAVPLTGTRSITSMGGVERDCSTTPLKGRLAWNGAKYGAYFEVHGCEGDQHAPYYGDKLAYVDDAGRAVPGGFGWKCSINQGTLLLPETGAFSAFCLSDGTPYQGVNLVVEDRPPTWLAPEMADVGYSAGKFGSVVKMADGSYVVAWLSRGVMDPNARPLAAARRAPDIALLQLDSNYRPVAPVTWLTETPDLAEANLHLARYGSDQLFVSWDSVENLACDVHTCRGTFTGTHGRLMNPGGVFLTSDELLPAPPNGGEQIAVLPNGDLAWGFVAEAARRYDAVLTLGANGVPDVPKARRLSVARLALCASD